jgi:hypothetical protein
MGVTGGKNLVIGQNLLKSDPFYANYTAKFSVGDSGGDIWWINYLVASQIE